MPESAAFVLDSFAVLAYLQDEPAAARVERLLDDAAKGRYELFLSVINLGEILYITERRGGVAKAQDTLSLILQLPVTIVPAEEQIVFSAAHIKANHTLSYADAFIVATTLQRNAILLTVDTEFQAVEELVQMEWLPTVQ